MQIDSKGNNQNTMLSNRDRNRNVREKKMKETVWVSPLISPFTLRGNTHKCKHRDAILPPWHLPVSQLNSSSAFLLRCKRKNPTKGAKSRTSCRETDTHTHTHHSNTYHSDTQTRFFLSSTRTHAHFTGRQGVDRSGIWSCLTWKEKKKGWKKEVKKNQINEKKSRRQGKDTARALCLLPSHFKWISEDYSWMDHVFSLLFVWL